MKCSVCKKEYSPNCDFNQGRCPNHTALIKNFPRWLLILAAPFIIIPWIIANPRKIWQQAKKDWNI
jgi:hypothetical protein